MLSVIAKYLVDPLVAAREGSSHRRWLRELEQTQYAPPERIARIQVERLRRLLIHARQNVPFYAERFEAAGFDPTHLNSVAELRVLPRLTKSDIQKHREQLKAANFPAAHLVPNQTGGSTGSPLRFFHDRDRLFSRKAATIRHDRWAGLDIGDKVAVLWGHRGDLNHKRSLKDSFLQTFHDRRIFLDTSEMTAARMATFAATLAGWRPRVYLAYANSMFLFARYIREQYKGPFPGPQSIITSAELLTDEQRQYIEDVFGCPVYNRYGSRETSVIASECNRHGGMHIGAELLLVEIEKDSRPCADGETGEVVITDLMNFGMPFIRYQIEDMAAPLSGPCACGRTLPRLDLTGGRVTDFLVAPDGRVVSGAALTIYFIATVPGIAQAQLVQEERHRLKIRLVKDNRFDSGSERLIAVKIKEFFGDTMQYELEPVANIPKTASGKYRFSISTLDPLEFLS